MNDSRQIGEVGAPRPLKRTHLWRLLLCCVLWAAVSFGCATVTYVTDVIYTDAGYGAMGIYSIKYDKGVYDALQVNNPDMTGAFAANQRGAGWTVEESKNGLNVLMRHKFDTLEDLKDAPVLIAGGADYVSDSFLQSLAITAQEINSDTVEYVYTATVVIPVTSSSSVSNSGGGDSGSSGDMFDIGDIFGDDPQLLAALEAAGPATIIIQANLPGEIVSNTGNDTIDGMQSGGSVRWTLREDQPGTYQIHAVSRGPSARAAEQALGELFGQSDYIQKFERALDIKGLFRLSAALDAANALTTMLKASGKNKQSDPPTRKEFAFVQAAFFANVCTYENGKRGCLLPNVTRAMPLIMKLAVRIDDNDDAAVAALESLVVQLIEHDLRKLEVLAENEK